MTDHSTDPSDESVSPRSANADGADGDTARSTFETTDGDKITGLLREQYVDNDIHFSVAGPDPRFRFMTIEAPHLAGDHLRSTIDYGGSCDPFDYYLFYICRHGQMRVDSNAGEQRLLPGDPTFFPPGQALDFDFHDMGLQTLKLAPGRLEQLASDLTDVPAAQVRFDSLEPISESARDRWNATFLFISAVLSQPESAPSAMVIAQLAHLLAATALETFPNSTMTVQQPGVGRVDPAALRRATNHIDAHADLPLTLADIATAAGTTGRAVQYAFRKHRNTTPLGYLRSVRLERAHRDLQHGDPTQGDTVAVIAARWGFANSGRFAADYRHAYGQPPSHTLRT